VTKKRPVATTTKRTRPTQAEKKRRAQCELWGAVAIVAAILLAGAAFYYFAVVRPNQQPNLTIATATPQEGVDSYATAEPTVQTDNQSGDVPMQWSQPPAMALDPTKTYEALIKTVKGDIRIQLYADLAPVTVNNFVFLARQGYYDGVTFHRVTPGFMAQTGDPTGTGMGGPGYQFDNEVTPKLRHDSEGIVAMANAGPNTNGSQFYITYGPAPHLDGGYSIFGKVISGMDVLRQITPRDPARRGPAGDMITTIEIIEQ